MSVGSSLIKTVVVIGVLGGIGYGIKSNAQIKSNVENNMLMVKDIKSQYKLESHKKPVVKKVTSDYQVALSKSNALLGLLNKLHSTQGLDSKGFSHVLHQISPMLVDPSEIQQSIIPYNINNWNTKVFYGGETPDNQIVMAYKFYDQQNNEMMISTFNYNVISKKISGFNTYETKMGRLQMLQASKA